MQVGKTGIIFAKSAKMIIQNVMRVITIKRILYNFAIKNKADETIYYLPYDVVGRRSYRLCHDRKDRQYR